MKPLTTGTFALSLTVTATVGLRITKFSLTLAL